MHHLSTHLLPLRLAGEEKPLNTSQPLLLRQKPGRVEVEPSYNNAGQCRPPLLSALNEADSSEYS